VWFGAGTVPAILTSAVISIFPVVVNVATGLASTEPELEDVLKVLGASKRDLLWNVGLPRSLPYLFASLKIAITLAFVGTVLSETVAANRGIGNVMMIASGNFDVPMVFAGLFILAGLGISLYAISSFIERRMTGWSQRKSEMAMA
jgi:NitT/TauT family transport system permease protein